MLNNGTDLHGQTSDINSARELMSMSGTSTSSVRIWWRKSIVAKTESWDGSAWTEVADLATNEIWQEQAGMQGSTSFAALQSGGQTPSYIATTEEFTAPSTFTQLNLDKFILILQQILLNLQLNLYLEELGHLVVDVNSARTNSQGAGASHSAAIIWSEKVIQLLIRSNTESYDGTSWTEVNDLNSA